MIVNNGGTGTACQFNYVLSSNIEIACNSAGQVELDLKQVQMSFVHGAASATNGYALSLGENGYVFSNTFSFDLEASQICKLVINPNISSNVWLINYDYCTVATNMLSPQALTGNTVIGGMSVGLKQEWMSQ